MAKKSEFKRLMKLEKGLPKTGKTFLTLSGYNGYGGVIAAWFKGNIGNTKDYVLVLNSDDEEYTVISKRDGEFLIETHTSLYQTFLSHKAARFN